MEVTVNIKISKEMSTAIKIIVAIRGKPYTQRQFILDAIEEKIAREKVTING